MLGQHKAAKAFRLFSIFVDMLFYSVCCSLMMKSRVIQAQCRLCHGHTLNSNTQTISHLITKYSGDMLLSQWLGQSIGVVDPKVTISNNLAPMPLLCFLRHGAL